MKKFLDIFNLFQAIFLICILSSICFASPKFGAGDEGQLDGLYLNLDGESINVTNGTFNFETTGSGTFPTLYGGTGSGDDLTFHSTSDATLGNIIFTSMNGFVWDGNETALSIGGDKITMTLGGVTRTHSFTIHNQGGSNAFDVVFHRHSATSGSFLAGARSRGSEASSSIVQNNDNLLDIYGLGFDGTDYEFAAGILFEVDGGPGDGDMPGRIVFLTTPDGSGTLSERLRIDSSGNFNFNSGNLTSLGTGHDNFSDFVAVEHTDWTAATSAFKTSLDSVNALLVEDSIGNDIFRVDTTTPEVVLELGVSLVFTTVDIEDTLAIYNDGSDNLNIDSDIDININALMGDVVISNNAIIVGTTTVNGFKPKSVTKTANYTTTATDIFIYCDASGGSFTITLTPIASHLDGLYHIKKIDSSANTVTIDGDGSETIDNALTAVLTIEGESVLVHNDQYEWWIN